MLLALTLAPFGMGSIFFPFPLVFWPKGKLVAQQGFQGAIAASARRFIRQALPTPRPHNTFYQCAAPGHLMLAPYSIPEKRKLIASSHRHCPAFWQPPQIDWEVGIFFTAPSVQHREKPYSPRTINHTTT